MVCLRATHFADVFARTQHGFLDIELTGFGVRQHRHGDQYYRHGPVYALPGNDAGEDAAVGVAQSGHGSAGDTCRQPAHGCAGHAAGGPLPGWTLLRHASWRLRRNVDALLLDFRPSGSLRSGASCLCLHFRDCSGIFTQSDFRLPGDGGGIDLHCVHRYERLGPSHVHGWYELQRQHLFRAHNDGYRCSDRHQDLQLVGDDVGRKDSLQDADALRDRLSLSILDRRSYGNHVGRSTVQLASWEFLLRGRALPLRHRGRNPLRGFRRFLLLVSEDVGKNVQRGARPAAFLALRYRLSSDLRFHAYPRTIRDAAENLYLRAGSRVGHLESDRDDWRVLSGGRHFNFLWQPAVVLLQGQNRRERSLGRVDTGMVDEFTPARMELPGSSCGQESPPALGSKAPGRSGLEVRVAGNL